MPRTGNPTSWVAVALQAGRKAVSSLTRERNNDHLLGAMCRAHSDRPCHGFNHGSNHMVRTKGAVACSSVCVPDDNIHANLTSHSLSTDQGEYLQEWRWLQLWYTQIPMNLQTLVSIRSSALSLQNAVPDT